MGDNQEIYPEEGIAIIGIGCIFPGAKNKDIFWENIINRVSGISEVPPHKWDPALYYSPDRGEPDKTYSKIGGFVEPIDAKSLALKFRIPPKTVESMDMAQRYGILAAEEALKDAGYLDRDFDRERTAVIIGNSMGGEKDDYTNLRIFYWDIERRLTTSAGFAALDAATREKIIGEFKTGMKAGLPEINEDTMPGELSNVIAGRIANILNLNGPNFTTDAACASSMASVAEAARGLRMRDFDMAIAGGVDFMMGPGPYVKFSKVGALSPDGSRPFDNRANGFVMGEGVGLCVLKRVSDARRDGDRIYAIIRGIGSSSDGRGKGITAPNPKGQVLAIRRALESAGFAPDTVQLIEAHGTSTAVGDAVELQSLCAVWEPGAHRPGSIGLGSVKSMIGHLKAAAGSASIIKTALSLHNRTMGPSINFETPNSKSNFGAIPFRVITTAEEWPAGIGGNPRRAGVSAFGFGGTNFHILMEEDAGDNGMPLERSRPLRTAVEENRPAYAAASYQAEPLTENTTGETIMTEQRISGNRSRLSDTEKIKLEGETILLGGTTWNEVGARIDEMARFIAAGKTENARGPRLIDISKEFNGKTRGASCRLAIAAGSVDDLSEKLSTAKNSLTESARWLMLRNKGIFFGLAAAAGAGFPGRIALLFPGQGSQYGNMMRDLYNKYQVVKDTFDEADGIMRGLIGCGITDKIFLPDDAGDADKKAAEAELRKTEYTQPAIITCNIALYRLLRSFGIKPDVVMGHSLGEYGALIVSGVMSFRDALTAVSARGKEMSNVKVQDNGRMASVSTDYVTVEETLKEIDGYVIPANKNCYAQTVIAGSTDAVTRAMKLFSEKGIETMEIPVSHAFHSKIVAPACDPYRRVLQGLDIRAPRISILANIDGEYYPTDGNVRETIIETLVNHMASPVEFVKQIERAYADGVRVFIETGPKKALSSFVMNIAGKRPHLAVSTNHPKKGGIATFNESLAALASYGLDLDWNGVTADERVAGDPHRRYLPDFLGVAADKPDRAAQPEQKRPRQHEPVRLMPTASASYPENSSAPGGAAATEQMKNYRDTQESLMREMLELYSKRSGEIAARQLSDSMYQIIEMEKRNINLERIMISGVSVGLPGTSYDVFGDDAFDRLLEGRNMIDSLTPDEQNKIVEKNITRVVKSNDGEARFETISDASGVVKLAGKMGRFNFEDDYGFERKIAEGLDITSKLAIAAAIEALKDAGIPLVQLHRETTTGKLLPSGWGLPESMQHDTGVVFASAMPGANALAEDLTEFMKYKYATSSKKELIELYNSIIGRVHDEKDRADLAAWFAEHYHQLGDADKEIYQFNSKFAFRMLSMGHSQLAQFIRARGPNVQVNTACSSTVSAIGTAEDWIRTGRCRRVIVVGAEALTHESFLEWITSGFLAIGAATTEADYRNAALPFDRRRNGTIIGMGAMGMVIEAETEVAARGMKPIAELVATELANSGHHVGRLDQEHVKLVMERLMKTVEKRLGMSRHDLAAKTLFMSHETFTPRRGGSASAEVESLKHAFGDNYRSILISNTKGFTGHPIGAGIEDVAVVRALQTGMVPPIANFRDRDDDLGDLNLSRGGRYENMEYGLRLAAGFGSQITLSFVKLVSRDADRVHDRNRYTGWMSGISGIDNPQLEVVNRALRIRDDGQAGKRAAAVRPASEQPMRNAIPGAMGMQKSQDLLNALSPLQADSTQATSVALTPAGDADADIRQKISAMVAEKTGYPQEMIEFDLDMESDLGIDTVKQAELFGSIRDTFKIPKIEGLQIKDYPTLGHVVQFVLSNTPDCAADTAATEVALTPSVALTPAGNAETDIRQKISAMVAEKTGYPQEMIEFDLDMESDLGIDTVKQAELFGSIRDTFKIPKIEGLQIKDYPTLGHVVQFVRSNAPDSAADTAASEVALTPQKADSAPTRPIALTPAGNAEADIRQKISAMVAEKTGYPREMIEFDLDMESDLGIDTVKQAELFGSIRDTFKIPKIEGLQIKDYPTLGHVVQFVRSNAPDSAADTAASEVALTPRQDGSAPAPSGSPESGIKRMVLETIEEEIDRKEEPRFSFEGMNILITDDRRGVAAALARLLEEQNARVTLLDLSAAEDEGALDAHIEKIKKSGSINGLIHLHPLEESAAMDAVDFGAWRALTFRRIKSLFLLARSFQKDLVEHAKTGGSFLVSATPMGGTSGIVDFTAPDPTGGGVSGLTKSLNKELDCVLVKTIDLAMNAKPGALARTILNEIQHGGDRVEVGYIGKKRMVPRIVIKHLDRTAEPAVTLEPGSVFVITGGGYGITGEIAKDLAGSLKPHIIILSGEGILPEAAELAALDDAGLQALKERVTGELKARGGRVTPVMIDREFGKYTRSIEKYRNMKNMEERGAASVECRRCDVTDHAAMKEALEAVIKKHGRIDAIIHGAGLEQSKLLEDKKFADFCRVFDVKADGMYNLVEITKDMPARVLVAFGSIAGRFGNIGQTDYSAGNDLMNKYARQADRRFSGRMKSVCINWTGWQGVGMATRGSIAKIFEESGIDMIPLEDGVPRVRDEILHGRDGEVIIAGAVGAVDSDRLIDGGGPDGLHEISRVHTSNRESYTMIGEILSYTAGVSIAAKKRLDPERDRYLKDHVIGSVPYLPAVMGIEAFAQAARLLFPDLSIRSMRNIRFRLPIKILQGKPVDILIFVEKAGAENGEIALTARIETEFYKNGVKLGENRVHFTGEILLSDDSVKKLESRGNGDITSAIRRFLDGGELSIKNDDIYRRFFHGPAFQVHGGVIHLDDAGVVGRIAPTGEDIFSFVRKPSFTSNPMAVEAAFQNAGIYGMVKKSVNSLPDTVGELVFRDIPSDTDLFIWARHTGSEENRNVYDTEIVDSAGTVYSAMRGYKMITTGELEEHDKF